MSRTQTRTESRTADKFVVRLPDGLRNTIFDVSVRSQRSMNGEIVYRLEQSLQDDQVVTEQSNLIRILTKRVDELEQQLAVAEGAV